jgi:hypothetical protein
VVVDASKAQAQAAVQECSVFIVPQVRDHAAMLCSMKCVPARCRDALKQHWRRHSVMYLTPGQALPELMVLS